MILIMINIMIIIVIIIIYIIIILSLWWVCLNTGRNSGGRGPFAGGLSLQTGRAIYDQLAAEIFPLVSQQTRVAR